MYHVLHYAYIYFLGAMIDNGDIRYASRNPKFALLTMFSVNIDTFACKHRNILILLVHFQKHPRKLMNWLQDKVA